MGAQWPRRGSGAAEGGQGAGRSGQGAQWWQGDEAAVENRQSASQGGGMRPRKPKLNEAQRNWVRDWWRALQPREAGSEALPARLTGIGRGDRARLRRCATADELLGEPSVLLFADQLIALGGEQWPLSKAAITY